MRGQVRSRRCPRGHVYQVGKGCPYCKAVRVGPGAGGRRRLYGNRSLSVGRGLGGRRIR
jgi:hypothetical protein